MDKKAITKREIKIVENWGFVKRSVLLSDVVDSMIEKGILTTDQWMDIKNHPISGPEKMEEFLYILQKQEPEALEYFVEVLRRVGLNKVADHLDGGMNIADGVRKNPEFQGTESRYKNTHEIGTCNNQDVWSSETTGAVRQRDLNEMKEEIKDELRKLSDSMVSEMKRDRNQMFALQREHKDLKNDFEKLQRKKFEQSERLDKLLKSVEELKNNLEKRENEYQELKRINDELKDDLIKQNIIHSKIVHQKEKENEELEKKSQKKTEEYKRLQLTMKSLKSEHGERYERLKILHREKIRLASENKTALAEKEEAEAKFQDLNQQAKEVKINHDKETSKLQSKIDTQMALIEELEKNKQELLQQLSLTKKENEQLKIENDELKMENEELKMDSKQLKDDISKMEKEKEKPTSSPNNKALFCSVVGQKNNQPVRRPPPIWRRGTNNNKW